jgi:hypothetical protein
LLQKPIKGLVPPNHAHLGSRPFLNGHQSGFQILDVGFQRSVTLVQRRVFFGLCLDGNA